MKFFYLLLFFSSLVFYSQGQITSTSTGGDWNVNATWVGGIIPGASDDVIIADGATVTINTTANTRNLTVGQGTSGVLQYETTTARTLTVNGSIVVSNGAFFQSALTGIQTGHILSLSGDITNAGTIDFSTNNNTAAAQITFTGNSNSLFSSTVGSVDLRQINMNKGSIAQEVQVNINTLTIQGASTGASGFLTNNNTGTFRFSGTNIFNSNFFTTANYDIQPTMAFWLDNPNATVNGQNADARWRGTFKITNGTFNIGVAGNFNSMSFDPGAVIIIEGGAVNSVGRFGVSNSGSAISYIQTAGTVRVNTHAGNNTNILCSFDLGASTSTAFTMSGGRVIIVRGSANTELRGAMANASGGTNINITGGVFQLGDATTPSSTRFWLSGIIASLEVNATNSPEALQADELSIYGDLTISGGSFSSSNRNFTIKGNSVTNPGNITVASGSTLTLNTSNATTVTFNSPFGNQILNVAGTLTNNALPRLTIDNTFPSGTVTLPSGLTLMSSSVLTLTAGTLTIPGTISFGSAADGNFTFNRSNGNIAASSGVTFGSGILSNTINYNYNQATASQTIGDEIPNTASISTLTIDNSNGVIANSPKDITLRVGIALSSGTLSGSGTIRFGNNAGTFTMTRSSGSISIIPVININFATSVYIYNAPVPAASTTTGNELAPAINSLTINNASGVILNSNLTVKNNLFLTNGDFSGSGSLTLGLAGSNTLAIVRTNGMLSISPSFITHPSALINVTYNEPAPAVAHIAGNELNTVVNNLTINNTSGVVLNKNLTTRATLTLTKGQLSGMGTLTLGEASSHIFIDRYNGSLAIPPVWGTTPSFISLRYSQTSPVIPITTGIELPAAIRQLNIENNGGVILDKAVTVYHQLAFDASILATTASNLLTLDSAAIIPNGSANSFVNGPLAIRVKTAVNTSRTFPIGQGLQWRPVVLNNFHTNGIAQIFIVTPITGPVPGTPQSPLQTLAYKRYYHISNTANIFSSSTATVQLSYGLDDNIGASVTARVAQSATSNGVYASIGGTATSFPTSAIVSTTSITSGSEYFVIGNDNSTPFVWDGGASTNNWGDAANWSTDIVPTNFSDVDFSSVTATINVNVAAQVRNITIGNSGFTLNILAGNSLTVNGNYTQSLSGTVSLNSGTLDIKGNFSRTGGTLNGNTAQVNFSGSAQTIQNGFSLYNVTLSGGTKTFTAGQTYTVTNNFEVQSTASIDLSVPTATTITVAKDLTYSATSGGANISSLTLLLTHTVGAIIYTTQTGLITPNITLDNAARYTLSNDFEISTGRTLTLNASSRLNTETATISGGGNLTLASGAILAISRATGGIAATLLLSGTKTYNAGDGSANLCSIIEYNANGNQEVSGTAHPANCGIWMSGSGTKTLNGNLVIAGSAASIEASSAVLQVASGTTFSDGGFIIDFTTTGYAHVLVNGTYTSVTGGALSFQGGPASGVGPYLRVPNNTVLGDLYVNFNTATVRLRLRGNSASTALSFRNVIFGGNRGAATGGGIIGLSDVNTTVVTVTGDVNFSPQNTAVSGGNFEGSTFTSNCTVRVQGNMISNSTAATQTMVRNFGAGIPTLTLNGNSLQTIDIGANANIWESIIVEYDNPVGIRFGTGNGRTFTIPGGSGLTPRISWKQGTISSGVGDVVNYGSLVNLHIEGNTACTTTNAVWPNNTFSRIIISNASAGGVTLHATRPLPSLIFNLNASSTFNMQDYQLTGSVSDLEINGKVQIASLGGFNSEANAAFPDNFSGFANSGSTIEYTASSGLQFITAFNYWNLIISGGGDKLMRGFTFVDGTLDLNNGKIITDDEILIITNSTQIVGGSANSYIATCLQDGITAATVPLEVDNLNNTVLIPVGPDLSSYNPVTITVDNGDISYFSILVLAQPVPGVPVNSAVNRTWDITRIAGSNPVTLALQYNAGEQGGNFNTAFARVVHYDVTDSEIDYGGAIGSQTGTGPFVVTGTGFTEFSPFGITGDASILATAFIQTFDGRKLGNIGHLEWTIRTINAGGGVRYFEVQKSSDGINFSTIGQVDGVINRTLYRYEDVLHAGNNFYRLKIFDIDGSITQSSIINILNSSAGIELSNIYPSIVNTGNITLNINSVASGKIGIVINDSKGRTSMRLADNIVTGTNRKLVNIKELAAGLYFITMYYNGKPVSTGKFIKQ